MSFLSIPPPLIALTFLWALFSLRVALGQDISVVYSLDEELPAGTFVGNIARDSNIRDLVGSQQEFRALTYSFLAEGSNFASNFRLRNDSGILSTRKVLDREALCSFRPECRLPLRLAAQSSQTLFFRIIDVGVMVRDVNDNAPFFQPPVVDLAVLENADVGDLFQLPTAVDADTGVNHSVQNYSLLTSGVPFGLHMESGEAASGAGLWLQLTGGLDREAVAAYRLRLLAVDGGTPAHTGTLTVNVQVGDVNDHAPVWEREYYSANVSEIEAVGSRVLTLRARDQDTGDNALVVYRFSPQQADIALGLFALNQTSGEVSVAKPLDSYAGQTYSLEVEARDSGTPFKTSRTDVIVHVMDTHNSRPDMILSVFGQGSVARLSEFSELGRVVAHIAVSDPDSGLNGIVLCGTDADHFELQAMDVRQYKVILSQPLDRETQAAHLVNVTCQDAGTPPIVVNKAFTVQVRDENDHYPFFSPANYKAKVTESAAGSGARDVYVTSVSATDNDVGENARLSYRVIEDPTGEFRMLDNGTLLAVRGLDREAGDNPRRVLVVAHDHGAIRNSATATVTLTIYDLNDNAPVFADPHPLFYVSEGAPAGFSLGNVTASDADAGDNAAVTFHLLQQPEDGEWLPFRVLPQGVIQTSGVLDREQVDRYQLSVVARDRGQPPLSSTLTATVVVSDVNDNSPTFLFPSPRNNSLRLPHTLPPHSLVTALLAYDADWGPNAELLYSREGVNGTVFFDVVPATGEVILVRPLTLSEVGEHVLTVAVHDQGTPVQLANQTLLYIHVYEANQSKVAVTREEESFRNTLLVVGIVAVTALLSLVVAVVIVVMKRKDRHKHVYRAKAAEYKVDVHLRHLASKQPWSHELQLTPVTSDLTLACGDQRRRKEVSFSLDEDNNIASGSAPVAPDHGNDANNLEAMQEVTHSKKRLLGPRGPEDDVSDVSCDVSTSDSGRGGSDVEMHSQQGASRESGDGSISHHRGPSRGSVDARRHLHPSPRTVTFDPYPLTFTSGRLTTFTPVSDDVSQSSRQPMSTFSSFSPLPRQILSSRASPSSSSASSLPPTRSLSRVAPCPPGRLGEGERGKARPLSVSSPRVPPTSSSSVSDTSSPSQSPNGLHHRSPQTQASHSCAAPRAPSLSPRALPSVSPPRPPSQGESYIDLHSQRRYEGDPGQGDSWPASALDGSYVRLKGAGSARQEGGDCVDVGAAAAATYVPSSRISTATTSTGTGDGETTLSGSYTLDPLEAGQDMDQLFFQPPGDVVV